MKFEEALVHHINGKNIRKKEWGPNHFLREDDCFIIKYLLYGEWEVEEEKEGLAQPYIDLNDNIKTISKSLANLINILLSSGHLKYYQDQSNYLIKTLEEIYKDNEK